MESNKHNDELIKRKLADLNAEPRKLDFATVHANYEKAKQTSSKKGGLYFIFGGIAIALLVSTYVLLRPSVDESLAQTNSIGIAQPINEANNITSVGTSTEDKFVERNNSENLVNTNAPTKETTEKTVTNNSSTTNESVANSENSNTKRETSTEVKKGTSTKNNTVVKKNETKIASKVEKVKPANDANNDLKKEELASNAKSNDNVPITRSGNSRGLEQNRAKTVKKGKNQETKPVTNTQPLTGSNVQYGTEGNDVPTNTAQNGIKNTDNTSGENKTKAIANHETSKNNKGNTDQSSVAQQGSNDQDNNGNTTNADPQDKNEVSVSEVREPDATTSATKNNDTEGRDISSHPDTATVTDHIPSVIGTGSVSPRNKHKWLIGAEASFNSITYNAKENPNSPSQFSTGDPAFSTAYTNAVGKGKHNMLTGALTFGYLYNEQIGVSVGLSYFNVKNTFSVGSTSTPQYTTVLDYYVWGFVQDTSSTITYKIVDSVYKQVQTGNTAVGTTVNGDSVSTASFENNIRYLNIPLNLSYNFKIGAKLSVEPQAGIVYAMPLKSQHLVATNAYQFEYNKQKTDLRKNLYFNAALKVGYNISNKMQVYVRGGYFFRNQSIYNADQPINMSLKSIYTSFGMTFRIK